jgi:hypothetical protein
MGEKQDKTCENSVLSPAKSKSDPTQKWTYLLLYLLPKYVIYQLLRAIFWHYFSINKASPITKKTK